MFARLAHFVTHRPLAVIGIWLLIAIGLRVAAPHWDSIAHDGDFSYLPSHVTSAVGERMLREAFPHNRARSQMALMVARQDDKLQAADYAPLNDLARRFHFYNATAALERATAMAAQAEASQDEDDIRESQLIARQLDAEITAAEHSFSEAIDLDRTLADAFPAYPAGRMPLLYRQYARFQAFVGKQADAAATAETADRLERAAEVGELEIAVLDPTASFPLLDLWTWRDEVVGTKLRSRDGRATLLVLQLSNEFMAADNIRVLQQVEQQLAAVRAATEASGNRGLTLAISGSAAVGGDMLRSAAESIRHTELFTVLLVIAILTIVYRSPLLVLAPLTTIGFSFVAATSVVALLTQLHLLPGFSWWDMKVFTTTRIFVVVILFGAGTYFCLFLISRYQEELRQGTAPREAAAAALTAVGEALVASALTTIVGLGMMFFADFGKFSHSGPVIGLCLLVTLLACLTLTPALLSLLGQWSARWHKSPVDAATGRVTASSPVAEGRFDFFWGWTARQIIARPGLILVAAFFLLAPWAMVGWRNADHVTYDFLSELDSQAVSSEGTRLMREYFPIGESGPVTLLVSLPGTKFDADDRDVKNQIRDLTQTLYLDGVASVRSLTDPLGDYPPGKRISIIGSRAWRTRLMRAHQRTEEVFVSQQPKLDGSVMRMEVILDRDPFSKEAAATVHRLEQKLGQITSDADSDWQGADFALTGVSAGLRDLRDVTQSDNTRIQVLVVLAVLAVLVVILRRPLVCLYLIASVLFTYYVTLGISTQFFEWAYGPDFPGLDWKAPLFLFVILVAIGQDYNVYLTTRVFEEQRKLGAKAGLEQAIIRTGGIISSCGLIMAGTFLAMTSGTWVEAMPMSLRVMLGWQEHASVLRGIVELGFALSLGVMLDTFIVRPILAPAFFALLGKWSRPQAA
jgi:putative drug exporter of the RND superfamily